MNLRVAIALLTTSSAGAQWLDYKTPGIPRTESGQPNLAAPAPRTADGKPDLSGLWGMSRAPSSGNIAAGLNPGEVQPWAEALYKQRQNDYVKEDPASYGCLPAGPRYSIRAPMSRIIQTPSLVVVLYDELTYRQIFLDGRELPKDPNPSFMGYSVGHWEGDVLVVESAGFNDRTWLDTGGHPHSELLQLTERFRRNDFGHIEVQVTIEDSKVYARSMTVPVTLELAPDTEMLEYVCNESPKDLHMVGKKSDEKPVNLPAETLSQYTGTYVFAERWGGQNAGPVKISVSGDRLIITLLSAATVSLTPVSETIFTGLNQGALEFLKNDRGVVAELVVKGFSEWKAIRQQSGR